jgi:uroporphyrin-III C-methyltransferase/precorrin-2 dehydrogenase/sirohydrochlorin ferrochelatase
MNEGLSSDEPGNPGAASDPPLRAGGSYPAFLLLRGRKVVVVGAGPVAASKLAGLRAVGARLTVIAPEVSPAMLAAAEGAPEADLAFVRRGFEPRDLEGAWYVVAAAPPAVNRAVVAAAEARCVFVNAVDDVAAATAHAGGVVRRGDVTIAISTGGDAPALAGLLREAFEAIVPEDVQRWAAEARALRPRWRADKVPMADRRPRLLDALVALYAGRKPDGERA